MQTRIILWREIDRFAQLSAKILMKSDQLDKNFTKYCIHKILLLLQQ